MRVEGPVIHGDGAVMALAMALSADGAPRVARLQSVSDVNGGKLMSIVLEDGRIFILCLEQMRWTVKQMREVYDELTPAERARCKVLLEGFELALRGYEEWIKEGLHS